jgi:hypothetical protein
LKQDHEKEKEEVTKAIWHYHYQGWGDLLRLIDDAVEYLTVEEFPSEPSYPSYQRQTPLPVGCDKPLRRDILVRELESELAQANEKGGE